MIPRALARRGAALAAAVLLLGACAEGGGDASPATFRGLALDPPTQAPALRLADARGDTFDLAEQRGRVTLLFFGYTHCPDICPTTLADWARVRDELGDRADGVRFVFVSVDPARDTPAEAERYAHQFDRSFIGLSADVDSLPALLSSWRIAAYEEPAPVADSAADTLPPGMVGENYFVAHSSQSFLVDREGRLRALYPPGTTSQDLLEDLRNLVR